ncbi:Uma2 family endonuclease [Phormidium pseudopriestleyi FRX01]|uniref:Uma2 family endonuclease n=1 Tax=Phormidium pseudopriestleyi FRX01 TaxID=1759528 RepID=A0ABS3FT27_9CYAN|nr:Uma2 family endonuclease [Phormidium pseudopriestleyi]MBO0350255.1 Uma2 family endonuclease [Phormidium pseudopriestleyi FRX01]
MPYSLTAEQTPLAQNYPDQKRITHTLSQLLIQHLRGTNAIVSLHPRPVYMEAVSAYSYPDLMVTHDPRDLDCRHRLDGVIQYPCLIIDVISYPFPPGEKLGQFDHYRQIETLEEYVWLDPTQPKLHCWRQIEPGVWEAYLYESGDDVYLDSLSFLIEIEAIYDQMLTR